MQPLSRTRTVSIDVVDDLKTLRKNGSTAESSSQQSLITTVETYSGVTNPAWRSQVEQVVNASTAFTGSTESFRVQHGNIDQLLVSPLASVPALTFIYRNHRVCFNKRSISDGDVSSISLSRANNLALSELSAKIYEQTTAFQGGTFLGELRRTIQMLRNPGVSLRRGISDFLNASVKHTKKVRSRRSADDIIADTWLEYSFGWKPLFNDISEAVNAVKKIRFLPYQDVVLTARGADETALSVGSSNAGGTQPFFNGQYYTTSIAEVQYKTCIRLGPELIGIPKQLGLHPVDWMPTAWNLLPWSFVVDYFTNIGDIITSLSACTVNRRWTTKTTRKRIRIDHIPTSMSLWVHNPWRYRVQNVVHPHLRQEKVFVAREPYTGSIIPSLEFQVPGAGLKWINMSALATQMFSSRKRINNRFS